jgi:hypothetical protein
MPKKDSYPWKVRKALNAMFAYGVKTLPDEEKLDAYNTSKEYRKKDFSELEVTAAEIFRDLCEHMGLDAFDIGEKMKDIS